MSDEDYMLRNGGKALAIDKEIGLENGKTTEGNGIGDSKHPGIEVVSTGKEIPKPKRAMKFKEQKSSVEEVETTREEETPIPLPSTMPYGSSNNSEL